jgi:predicted transcriptional regulator
MATTIRFDSVVKDGLTMLRELLGRPINQLVNEAVKEYVARLTLELENDLESTLDDLRAYRKSDQNFDRAIAKFVKDEAAVKHDPAEGRIVTRIGPTESVVRKLLSE